MLLPPRNATIQLECAQEGLKTAQVIALFIVQKARYSPLTVFAKTGNLRKLPNGISFFS